MENFKHNDTIMVIDSSPFGPWIKLDRVGRIVERIDRENLSNEYLNYFEFASDNNLLMIEFYDHIQEKFLLTVLKKSVAKSHIVKSNFNYENIFPAPDRILNHGCHNPNSILVAAQKETTKANSPY